MDEVSEDKSVCNRVTVYVFLPTLGLWMGMSQCNGMEYFNIKW